MTKDEQFTTLYAAIPTSGAIDFDDLRKALVQSDQVEALDVFHVARRDGRIACKVTPKGDGATLMVSRPVAK